MKKPFLSLAAACALVLSVASVNAAAPKDYQVTGPILSMTDTTVVVKKGQEDWELTRTAALKPADGSELKVGDKVTIHYTMTATTVEKKAAPAPKKEKAPAKAAASPAASAAPTASPAAKP